MQYIKSLAYQHPLLWKNWHLKHSQGKAIVPDLKNRRHPSVKVILLKNMLNACSSPFK